MAVIGRLKAKNRPKIRKGAKAVCYIMPALPHRDGKDAANNQKEAFLIQKTLKNAFFFVHMQTISKITTNFAKICGHGDCMSLMRTILIIT